MTVTKNGNSIQSLHEWEQQAGPKSERQWKDGRSAKETARAWLAVTTPALPPEIASLLQSHEAFDSILEWSAEPEVRLPFDNMPGETRNSDLLINARDTFGKFLVAIEAKADEPFGDTVRGTFESARERLAVNANSGGVKRLNGLLSALFASSLNAEPALGELRYQLLTAMAGAVSLALREGGQRVVLCVQEFQTDATSDAKHAQNAAALDAFVARLSSRAIQSVKAGQLVGPFTLQGSILYKACPLIFVGKVRHWLRRESAA